jgi:GH15 family glucan-1,4-alpha-glucosidase
MPVAPALPPEEVAAMSEVMLPAPIGDQAVIGDCRSVALVSTGGSIDWLCVPRFESPAIYVVRFTRVDTR